MPTLSITITIARRNGALLMGEIIGHRFRRLDRGDRVLEDHVVGSRLIEHQREAIEVLDPAFELGAVHHADGDHQLLAAHVVGRRPGCSVEPTWCQGRATYSSTTRITAIT